MQIKHKFCELIPNQEDMEFGVIYISIKYKTSSHLCMCGCGELVVTPIKPKRWKLTFNGDTISLYPSIGNCNLNCRSHYWIENNEVEFYRRLSKSDCYEKIDFEKFDIYNKKPQNKPSWLKRVFQHKKI